jgi:hypothetical protein
MSITVDVMRRGNTLTVEWPNFVDAVSPAAISIS